MSQEQDAGPGALIDRLATATLGYPDYRYRLRGWGEWIALDGLLAAAETTGNQRYLGFVEGLVAGWIDPTRRLGRADRLAPAGVLLRLHEFRADPDLLSVAQQVASLLVRDDGRTTATPIPDSTSRVWVDSLYTEPTLLVRLGRAEGDERRRNEQAVGYAETLLDLLCGPDPLPAHGYDTSGGERVGLLWGRGIGWAILGLVDVVEELPANATGRDILAARVAKMSIEMTDLQAESGNWHTVVTDASTVEERSVAAFLAAALWKAIRIGLIDRRFDEPAQRAWNAVVSGLRADGTLPVSAATPPGDADEYSSLPLGIYPWGQGPALLAAIESLRRRDVGVEVGLS